MAKTCPKMAKKGVLVEKVRMIPPRNRPPRHTPGPMSAKICQKLPKDISKRFAIMYVGRKWLKTAQKWPKRGFGLKKSGWPHPRTRARHYTPSPMSAKIYQNLPKDISKLFSIMFVGRKWLKTAQKRLKRGFGSKKSILYNGFIRTFSTKTPFWPFLGSF